MNEQHVLENEFLKVIIADHGAELISIYDKGNKHEVIWQADPSYWKRHAPVLFPNVGKHYLNTYRHRGNEYLSGQHGFARDKVFTCVANDKLSVTHQLKADAETLKIYPFSFCLEIIHVLHERDVEVRWKVYNEGGETMYFTIGGHPAFRVPVLEETKQSDYYLMFKNDRDLEYVLIDQETGTAIVDQKYLLKLENRKCLIKDGMFDRDALIFDNQQIQWAAIAYPDGKPYVSLECKGFPSFGIWSVPGAPYVCLEPWVGRCDNKGYTGEIKDKQGIISLEAGKKFQADYRIRIY